MLVENHFKKVIHYDFTCIILVGGRTFFENYSADYFNTYVILIGGRALPLGVILSTYGREISLPTTAVWHFFVLAAAVLSLRSHFMAVACGIVEAFLSPYLINGNSSWPT